MHFLKFLFPKPKPLSKVLSSAVVSSLKPTKIPSEPKTSLKKSELSSRSDLFEYAGDLLTLDDEGYFIEPEGSYDLDIVGEASYQKELEIISGPRSDDGAEFECKAVLKCENDNEFDKHAVCVKINDMSVGYLSKADAKQWRKMLKKQKAGENDVRANAQVVGGWKANEKKGTAQGHFGVKLDVPVDED